MDTQEEVLRKLNGVSVGCCDDEAVSVHEKKAFIIENDSINTLVTSHAKRKASAASNRVVSFSNVDQQHWYECEDTRAPEAEVVTQPEAQRTSAKFSLSDDEDEGCEQDGAVVVNGDCSSELDNSESNCKDIDTNNTSHMTRAQTSSSCRCDEPASDVTVSHTPPPKLHRSQSSWLLRLFESKHFDMSMAISYLFNSKEHGVQAYIGLYSSLCSGPPFPSFQTDNPINQCLAKFNLWRCVKRMCDVMLNTTVFFMACLRAMRLSGPVSM